MESLVVAIMALGGTALIFAVIILRARRSLPEWMVQNKLTTDGATYSVRVGAVYGGRWKPGGEYPEYLVYGPATAFYRREDTPEGPVVHLELKPDMGPVKHYSGPIPARALPAWEEDRESRRRGRLAILVLLVPVIFACACAGLAWKLADGQSESARTFATLGGLTGGIFVVWLLGKVLLVGDSVRKTLRR